MPTSNVVRKAAQKFRASAAHYLDWVAESANGSSIALSMRELHLILANLQVAAAQLPVIAPDKSDASDVESHDHKEGRRIAAILRQRLPFDEYCFVFNPLDEDDREAIVTTIEDDLGDIYNDLADGTALYDAGRYSDAIWEWRFSYYSHWGRHAVHAQAAIWQFLADGNNFD